MLWLYGYNIDAGKAYHRTETAGAAVSVKLIEAPTVIVAAVLMSYICHV